MEQKSNVAGLGSVGRPGAVLVYSLLVLSTLLIVVTGFSLYVTRASRTLAVATDTAVATYVAESGVEEGLFLLRRDGVNVADIAFPYARLDGSGAVLDEVDPLASIASTSAAATYDADDLRFFDGIAGFSGTAYAELRSTSTVKEIVMDVPQDDVAYADVYDASGATDLAVGSGIGSVLLEWDQGTGAAWLEASIVELDAQPSGPDFRAELRTPRTQVLGPSLHSGYCFNDLSAAGANLHRLRFRALFADIRNLKVTGYRDTSCPEEASPAVLPGRTTVTATGRYRRAKQTVQISMPQQTLPSGLFGFVVFSDQSLVKLSAGVGNLQFWPQIPSGDSSVWPDGVPSVANTYRFMYPLNVGVPSLPSSTVEVLPGRFGPGATEQVPAFVLVNTDRSGITFASGDVTLTASGNYADKFQLDYSFATQDVGGVQVLAADDQLRTCQGLAGAGPLTLTAYGTPPTNILDGEGNPVGSYYTDRCAVGVRLTNPSDVTTAIPLRGRLVAYADPGGTASVALEYDPPMPVLRVERQQEDSSWAAVTNGTIYDFGGIAQNGTETTNFRICNVGTQGTTLTVQGGDIVVDTTDPDDADVFSKQSESGVPAALHRVPGSDCSVGDTVTFGVEFSPTDPVAYSGTLDVASNAPDYRISLRGNAAISAPDWDGNWDCWGIGDTNGNGTNEVRCGWTKFSGIDSYELQAGSSCSDGNTVSGLDPIVTVSSASCGASTCSYTYEVAGDTAALADDDRFRCHQIRSIAGSSYSLWSSVRGTTGSTQASLGAKRFFVAYSTAGNTFDGNLYSRDGNPPNEWYEGANQVCTQWAMNKLGVSGNFKAWLCGRHGAGDTPTCQNLATGQTYVWLDSGPESLPGVSFRTDVAGVPANDYWRGGTTGECLPSPSGSYSDCRTERKHVLSLSDDSASFFYSGRDTTGTIFDSTAQACADSSARSWRSATGAIGYHLGRAGRFGGKRWFLPAVEQSGDDTSNACTQQDKFGIYCFEETGSSPDVRIAVTSVGYTGAIDGTSNPNWWLTANGMCSSNLGGRWKALLWRSGGASLAQPTIYAGTRYVNVGGQTLFTASSENVVPSTLLNSVSTSNVSVWTGYGSGVNRQCIFNREWQRGSVNERGSYGRANSIISTWLNSATLQCNGGGEALPRLYCVESLEDISVTPSTLDFGILPTGVTNQTAEVSISNAGTGPLRVESLAISGSAFTLVSPPATPFIVAAGDQRAVTVRFTQASPGTPVGSLTIVSTDANQPTIAVPLMGSGAGTVRYRIAVTSNTINGNIQAYSAAANWWDDANQFCSSDPAISAMGGTWRALLWGGNSSATYLPQTVITSGRSYANVDGELLYVASANNNVPTNLYHNVSDAAQITWTGQPDNRWHCANAYTDAAMWTFGDASRQADQGNSSMVDRFWLDAGIGLCNNTRHLYCVEQ